MPDAIKSLIDDHLQVHTLFQQMQKLGTTEPEQELTTQIRSMLTIHTVLEEEFIYPILAELDADLEHEATAEHAEAQRLMDALEQMSPRQGPDSEFTGEQSGEIRRTMGALRDAVMRHVSEEEELIFPKLQAGAQDRLDQIGNEMYRRRQELMKEWPSSDKAAWAGNPAAPYPKI